MNEQRKRHESEQKGMKAFILFVIARYSFPSCMYLEFNISSCLNTPTPFSAFGKFCSPVNIMSVTTFPRRTLPSEYPGNTLCHLFSTVLQSTLYTPSFLLHSDQLIHSGIDDARTESCVLPLRTLLSFWLCSCLSV